MKKIINKIQTPYRSKNYVYVHVKIQMEIFRLHYLSYTPLLNPEVHLHYKHVLNIYA